MKIIFLPILILLSQYSLADFSGTVGYRERIDEEELRSYRKQYRVNIRYRHKFGKDSCISFNARILSGGRFGSGSVDFGNDSTDIALRHLYLDVKCLIDKSIQIGAIPTDHISPLDLDKGGWVDGLKVTLDLNGIIDEARLTYGSLDRDGSVSVFNRFDEDFNEFIRLTLVKKLSDELKATLAISSFNDDVIYQGILDFSLADITPFIDEIQVYTATGKSQHYHTGVEFSKKYGLYSVSAGFIKQDSHVYPTSSFYGQENAIYFSVSRTFKERIKVTIRARKGETENQFQAQVEYRF